MQSFWKLKVLEHILLKSNAIVNLILIEVQFLTMQLQLLPKMYNSHFMSVFKICFPAWILWFWLKVDKSCLNTIIWFHKENNVVLIE